MVAPTYTMLRDICWPVFLQQARRLRFLRDTIRSRLAAILGNGAAVLFRSADQPDRLRGLNVAGAWIDEASLVCREVYDVVLLTLREPPTRGWPAHSHPKARAIGPTRSSGIRKRAYGSSVRERRRTRFCRPTS